jgi:hypothetical protein
MTHWLQYHNPDFMEYGVDEVSGPPFVVYSSKVILPIEGSTIWLVGRRAAIDLNVYLAGWMLIAGVRSSAHPSFDYEYFGDEGLECDPMPAISDEPWYPELLKLTGSFRFGLTELKKPSLVSALRELSEDFAPRRRRRPPARRRR